MTKDCQTGVAFRGGARQLARIMALALAAATAAAWASGFPPFAREDSMTVFQGGTVTVLDSGQKSVLDNDFDFENDPLTAQLSRDVRDGTLTLNVDGTFTYTHDGDDDDSDRFFYRALDGTGRSRRTRVNINVIERDDPPPEPEPPEIVGQNDVDVAEDGSVVIGLDDLKVTDLHLFSLLFFQGQLKLTPYLQLLRVMEYSHL